MVNDDFNMLITIRYVSHTWVLASVDDSHTVATDDKAHTNELHEHTLVMPIDHNPSGTCRTGQQRTRDHRKQTTVHHTGGESVDDACDASKKGHITHSP